MESSANSSEESVFLKSNRLATSRDAWSTALRISWASTSEVMSKLGIRGVSLCSGGRFLPLWIRTLS